MNVPHPAGGGLPSHRPAVVLAAIGFGLLATTALAYRLFGHALVERLTLDGTERARETLWAVTWITDYWVWAALSLAGCVYGLVVFSYTLASVRPRRWVGVSLGIGLYLAIETFMMPGLAGPLGMKHYQAARDPDHWPDPGRPGMNADGLQHYLEAEEFQAPGFNIVFLGDSFTAGFMLRDPFRGAFPQLVGQAMGRRFPGVTFRVANLAWVSSSPLLSYRRLLHLGSDYRPDLIVLAIDMGDPHDDIRWANIIERRGIVALYERLPLTVHAFRTWFPDSFRAVYDYTVGGNLPRHRFFHSEQPLEMSRPFLEPMARNIDLIHVEATRMGVPFVVFVLPRGYQYDARESPDDWEMRDPDSRHTLLGPYSAEIFRWFEEMDDRSLFPVHSLLPDFQAKEVFPTCFDNDPHWNMNGHRVAARGISRHLYPEVARVLRAAEARAATAAAAPRSVVRQ